MHSRQDYGMRNITRLETFVIGDGPAIDPEGSVEPLACLRPHTDDGLVGLSEVFRVPPVRTVAACRSCSPTCGELTEAKRIVDLAVQRGALVCRCVRRCRSFQFTAPP
jgi:hypothetical protein